ncbi:MAG: hypothetical protein HC812_18355 [Leptolyngbya sp. RL_3_1]|nr:hypothetical protein [Leptolyngbya sp. RL_3_1]
MATVQSPLTRVQDLLDQLQQEVNVDRSPAAPPPSKLSANLRPCPDWAACESR